MASPSIARRATRSALLIHNPAAGSSRAKHRLDELTATLAASGFAIERAATTGPGAAVELAREAAARGLDAVFALGGDGTVRQTAAGLLGTPTALGVLAAGTTNVVARALGLPLSPLAAARAAADWTPRTIDAGLCAGLPFLMQATFGLDAAIMAITQGPAKARFGRAAVLAQGLREWLRYRWPQLQIVVDGEPTAATFAAVCNLAEYAGPFRIAPEALPDDGRLDLVLFRGGRAAYLGFVLAMVRGRHAARRDVEIKPVTCVWFAGPSEARAQLDGDALELPLPLEITIAPERLRVLAPPAPVVRPARTRW